MIFRCFYVKLTSASRDPWDRVHPQGHAALEMSVSDVKLLYLGIGCFCMYVCVTLYVTGKVRVCVLLQAKALAR